MTPGAADEEARRCASHGVLRLAGRSRSALISDRRSGAGRGQPAVRPCGRSAGSTARRQAAGDAPPPAARAPSRLSRAVCSRAGAAVVEGGAEQHACSSGRPAGRGACRAQVERGLGPRGNVRSSVARPAPQSPWWTRSACPSRTAVGREHCLYSRPSASNPARLACNDVGRALGDEVLDQHPAVAGVVVAQTGQGEQRRPGVDLVGPGRVVQTPAGTPGPAYADQMSCMSGHRPPWFQANRDEV